jgi:hypothetical protein
LSESQLHSLIGSAQDASLPALDLEATPEDDGETAAAPIHDARAATLQALLLTTIEAIEQRAERLSAGFRDLVAALDRLDGVRAASRWRAATGGNLPAIQKELLREMFF